jgi:hypothetical protein
MLPAAVFHGIIVASQSLHPHTAIQHKQESRP